LHTHASSCTIHHFILTSFPAPEKREREKRRRKEKERKRELPAYRECCFSFLLKPLEDKTGLLPR
jgi:hypothetical protein